MPLNPPSITRSLPHNANKVVASRDAKIAILRETTLGERIAEEERDELARYFVQTDYWRKIFAGKADIVYGNKGTGKSAIYLLILAHEDGLFDRGILLISGENVRGTPVFHELVTDPPAGETEFINLWKLYLLSLLGQKIREYGLSNDDAVRVQDWLESLGLIDRNISLTGLLKVALDYVRRVMRLESMQAIEGGISFDPNTGVPIGATGKIIFREPSLERRKQGVVSADEALQRANSAFRQAGFTIWILLDRLDVAFAETAELEKNALRALFRVYRDFGDLDSVRLKIFLRSDIWKKVTEEGFRESSHITSSVILEWDPDSLLNLLIRRLINNQTICDSYEIDREQVMQSIELQRSLFYRLFPDQVDLGQRKPQSFDWLLSRTADGTGRSAPRELIHLVSCIRDVQLQRYERGEAGASGELLFERAAFKEALPQVSRARLEQTLFAEYPEFRERLLMLKDKKTEHDIRSLSQIWDVSEEEASTVASKLVEIGFFERRTEATSPSFWVPFLYRDALEMVQGKAE